MSIEKLRFYLWDGAGMIASLIEKWEPKGCRTEKHYETSIYEFLHDNLRDLQVTKQFAKGRVRADLAVEGKLIIELKNNVDSTPKFHRLVGQLTDYETWGGAVFLVLCGKTDRNLLKEIRKHLEQRKNSFSFMQDHRFQLFEK